MSRPRSTSRRGSRYCKGPGRRPATVGDDPQTVIPIESDADVVTARQRAREMAGKLDLTSTDQTLLATAISEVARNITTYAVRGEVQLSVVRDDNGRRGIQVIAR